MPIHFKFICASKRSQMKNKKINSFKNFTLEYFNYFSRRACTENLFHGIGAYLKSPCEFRFDKHMMVLHSISDMYTHVLQHDLDPHPISALAFAQRETPPPIFAIKHLPKITQQLPGIRGSSILATFSE